MMMAQVKKAHLKTKTLVDALQSLKLIPSFSTSNFGGDILPENVLVRNILDGMIHSVSTLALVVQEIKSITDHQSEALKPYMIALADALNIFSEEQRNSVQQPTPGILPITVEDYDADTEVGSNLHEESKLSKRSRKKEGKMHRVSTAGSQSSLAASATTEADYMVIRASRDVLLLIQNDKKVAAQLARELADKDLEKLQGLQAFLAALTEMVEYAKSCVTIPYETHMTEIESLCGSIFMSQKLQKTTRKFQATIDEIRANHRALIDEKFKEKRDLIKAANSVRAQTSEQITEMHNLVDTKIKTLAWNSHARQTKAMNSCTKLKHEYDDTIEQHSVIETKLRHANIKLETEISEMITSFDATMFEKHEAFDKITFEYASEKQELIEAEKDLEKILAEKESIIAEQKQMEKEERDAQLKQIRKNVAAKCIQRAWRSFKARMLLKKKKRKKK